MFDQKTQARLLVAGATRLGEGIWTDPATGTVIADEEIPRWLFRAENKITTKKALWTLIDSFNEDTDYNEIIWTTEFFNELRLNEGETEQTMKRIAKRTGQSITLIRKQNKLTTRRFYNETYSMSWQSALMKDKEDRNWLNTAENVKRIFANHEALRNRIFFDKFSQTIRIKGAMPWNDDDRVREWKNDDFLLCMTWIQSLGVQVNKETVYDGVLAYAHTLGFNPVRDMILRCQAQWDGKNRLVDWLAYVTGNKNDEYISEVGSMWIKSIVARAFWLNSYTKEENFDTGCKVDYMPVFIGDQGDKKSMIGPALVGELYADTLLHNIKDKDVVQNMFGSLIKEIAEIDKYKDTGNKQISAADIKAFLTIQCDKVRLPYARTMELYPRTCVFYGTANTVQFIDDHTGGRRFWPIHVNGQMKIEVIKEISTQLFGEAAFRVLTLKEDWWPNSKSFDEKAKEIQSLSQAEEPWEVYVKKMICTSPGETPQLGDGTIIVDDKIWVQKITTTDILLSMGLPQLEQGIRETSKVGRILSKLGYTKQKTMKYKGEYVTGLWVKRIGR